MSMERVEYLILLGAVAALTLLALVTLVRSILGPRFTDRIVAVNMVNTMVVAILAILALVMEHDFLVDVALVYALLSFLAMVVLAKLVLSQKRRASSKEGKRDGA